MLYPEGAAILRRSAGNIEMCKVAFFYHSLHRDEANDKLAVSARNIRREDPQAFAILASARPAAFRPAVRSIDVCLDHIQETQEITQGYIIDLTTYMTYVGRIIPELLVGAPAHTAAFQGPLLAISAALIEAVNESLTNESEPTEYHSALGATAVTVAGLLGFALARMTREDYKQLRRRQLLSAAPGVVDLNSLLNAYPNPWLTLWARQAGFSGEVDQVLAFGTRVVTPEVKKGALRAVISIYQVSGALATMLPPGGPGLAPILSEASTKVDEDARIKATLQGGVDPADSVGVVVVHEDGAEAFASPAGPPGHALGHTAPPNPKRRCLQEESESSESEDSVEDEDDEATQTIAEQVNSVFVQADHARAAASSSTEPAITGDDEELWQLFLNELLDENPPKTEPSA